MSSLSKYFKTEEFFSKDTFRMLAYSHEPKWHICPRLIDMLDNIREHFNAPVTITSGYRSQGENIAAGGAKNSMHKEGKAADIIVKGATPSEVQDYCRKEFDAGGLGTGATFTHLDSRHSDEQIEWGYS